MNVAFVLDGVLVTPPLTDTILAGVTRDTLLTLAREHGIPCEERPIALEELTAAMVWGGLHEAFACSTGVGVASIRAFNIDDQRRELPPATPVANRLRELLRAHQTGATPAHAEWRVRA